MLSKEIRFSPGVKLRMLHSEKFKNFVLGFNFLAPLQEETAAENALVAQVLKRGTRSCPDMERMSAALDGLYGGTLQPVVRKKGEVQCLGFWGSFLEDRYIPEPSRNLADAAALLRDVVLDPAGDGSGFVEEYVLSEKENLIQAIRSEVNDKRQYALASLREKMCAGEAFGVSRIGDVPHAEKITPDSLYARYRALVEKAPVCLYYCGSALFEEVEDILRTAFAPLLEGEREAVPATKVVLEPAGEVRVFEESLNVTQGKLSMGFRMGRSFREPSDVASAILFNAVFGSGPNSKLFLNVREKQSLCYYASSTIVLGKGVLFVNSGVDSAKMPQAEEEILRQLSLCRDGEITEEELAIARRSAVNSLKSQQDSQSRLEEYWLTRSVTGTEFTAEDLIAEIEKVTVEDIVRVAEGVRQDAVFRLLEKEGASDAV